MADKAATALTSSSASKLLPRVGTVRRCPSCKAGREEIRRWPESSERWLVACSSCDAHWYERSARGVLDWLADLRERALFCFLCSMVALALVVFVFTIVLRLIESAPRIGNWDASGFGVIILAVALSGFALAYWLYLRDKQE
jgi:hypothetical protein